MGSVGPFLNTSYDLHQKGSTCTPQFFFLSSFESIETGRDSEDLSVPRSKLLIKVETFFCFLEASQTQE
jgi:hypothetical protein